MPGKAPGKVPVHYFGTQEFAWMRSSDVVSFGAGLQNGMHVCKPSNRSKAAFLRALHEVSVYFLVRKDTLSAVLILHFHSSHMMETTRVLSLHLCHRCCAVYLCICWTYRQQEL